MWELKLAGDAGVTQKMVEQSNSWGACAFTDENTLAKPCYFLGNEVCGVAEKMFCFCRSRARSGQVVNKKRAGLKRELGLHFKRKKWQPRSKFGRWGRQNVRDIVARTQLYKKMLEFEGLGVARNSTHCRRCANVGRFGATLLLCRIAAGVC